MRIYEMINIRKNSLIFQKIFLTYFLRICTVSKYQNQSGEFVCGYWGLKGLTMRYKSKKEKNNHCTYCAFHHLCDQSS